MIEKDERLAGELALRAVRLTRHLRTVKTRGPLSLTQISALTTLSENGSMTPGQLAIKERIQPPSMTRIITALSIMGLIDRNAHPTDGRQLIISVSESGRRLLDGEGEFDSWLPVALEPKNDADRAAIRRVNEMISEILEDGTAATYG